jgi:hypothetical protein
MHFQYFYANQVKDWERENNSESDELQPQDEVYSDDSEEEQK